MSFVSPKAFRRELATTFQELCTDANLRVRVITASVFHQVRLSGQFFVDLTVYILQLHIHQFVLTLRAPSSRSQVLKLHVPETCFDCLPHIEESKYLEW